MVFLLFSKDIGPMSDNSVRVLVGSNTSILLLALLSFGDLRALRAAAERKFHEQDRNRRSNSRGTR